MSAGGFFGSVDQNRRRASGVAVTAELHGGVAGATPTSGEVDLGAGVDYFHVWRRVGVRAGAFGGGGFLFDARPSPGFGLVGARVALSPVLRSSLHLHAGCPGCWDYGAHLLGIEASVAWWGGPNRAVLSLGPMYELIGSSGGGPE